MKANALLAAYLFFQVSPLVRSAEIHGGFTRRNSPSVLTILCGANSTGNRVIVADLNDAERIDESAGNCIIINLTMHLIVATNLAIYPVQNGRRIKVLVEGGVTAAVPCYENSRIRPHEYVSKHGTFYREYAPSDLIRINGESMTLLDAVIRFPNLPIAVSKKAVSGMVPETLDDASELKKSDSDY